MKIKQGLSCALLLLSLAGPALADGASLVKSNGCGDCHDMKGPAPRTTAGVFKRKAPDLFYAGSKFKKEWLVKFLQKPASLRPAGPVYVNYIKNVDGQDTLTDAPNCASSLNASDSEQVADYLMSLKDSGMRTGVFKQKQFMKFRAELLVVKQGACNACHEIPGKGGGVSAPTFEGIGGRLNPDWMIAFIKDPQYWYPRVWMPKHKYNDDTVQLIVNYLTSMK